MFSLSAALVAVAIATVSAKPLGRRAVTLPPENGKWDYQLGGPYDPPTGTEIVVRDRTEPLANVPYNICYINGFQTQPDEGDWWKENHDALLLRRANGSYFEDLPDWPGEFFLDTRTPENRAAIAEVINPWITECATNGFNAVEPDNLDSFTRSEDEGEFLLTRDHNLALAALYANHAHSSTVDIAIAQKNVAELGTDGRDDVGFDFAIAEECERYNECEEYSNAYGTAVLEIEYTDYDDQDPQEVFARACEARRSNYSIILRDRDLVPLGHESGEYHYEEC